MVCNMNIYEFCGLDDDPLYRKFEQLDNEKCIAIDKYLITVDKFFEVQCDDFHELFYEKSDCYRFLSDILTKN